MMKMIRMWSLVCSFIIASTSGAFSADLENATRAGNEEEVRTIIQQVLHSSLSNEEVSELFLQCSKIAEANNHMAIRDRFLTLYVVGLIATDESDEGDGLWQLSETEGDEGDGLWQLSETEGDEGDELWDMEDLPLIKLIEISDEVTQVEDALEICQHVETGAQPLTLDDNLQVCEFLTQASTPAISQRIERALLTLQNIQY